MRQPLVAIAEYQAKAFGGGIELVNDRPPPLDHLLLDLRRTWRRAMDRGFQRRQIVAQPRLLGELQHARKHRRHEHCMCRAIAFNESQELLRVEMLHDDRSAARMDCQRDCCQRRRVINRRRLKVDRAFAETPCFLKKIVDREVLGRRLVWQWTQNALWPASGAGGIKHCGPESLVGDRRVWDSGRRLVYIANEDAISVAVSDQAQPDIWASLQCRQRHRALCPRRDE